MKENNCSNCGDTGRGKPTLQEPDGEECEECLSGSDIAAIEALHDLLLDVEGYQLNHPILKISRELTAKLYKIVGYKSKL